MRFFVTAEAYKTVSSKIVHALNAISKEIELSIKDKDYGQGVFYWGYITICCPPEFYSAGFFKEIKKYTKKDKEVELRLKIDYEAMLKADDKEVFRLISESLLSGIDIAENEFSISDFSFNTFRNDLKELFKRKGWI